MQPWQNKTYSPANRYVFERNPYYHRVDQNGVQLPYVDQVVINIAESSIIPAKTGSGEADLQERYLGFADYTFLKEGEKRNNYTVRLWTVGKGSAVALFPNLNTNDTGWRTLFRDVRFRRALSLGIDRTQINQVLFAGLAKEGASTVLPGTPALPRRARQRLCAIRSRQGQCAARRDRPEAGRQRHPPDAGRKAARP